MRQIARVEGWPCL